MTKRKPPAPKPPRVTALYRAQLSCKIGRDALEGKTGVPVCTRAAEYALFNLLHAVEEIAVALEGTHE